MPTWSQVIERDVAPKLEPVLQRHLGSPDRVRFTCHPGGMQLRGDPGENHTLLACALTDERLVAIYEHGLLRLKYYCKVLDLTAMAGPAYLGAFEFGGSDVFTVNIPHRSGAESFLWFDAEPDARLVVAQLSGDPARANLERSFHAIEQNRDIDTEPLDDASPEELAAIPNWMRERFGAGDYRAVWQRRVAIAFGLPRDRMRQQDYFWTNALGALAGLELRQNDHPMVPTAAGLAEQAVDRADPEQVEAIERINRQYLG
jgi:hypothetical protein